MEQPTTAVEMTFFTGEPAGGVPPGNAHAGSGNPSDSLNYPLESGGESEHKNSPRSEDRGLHVS
jgi:hypothetical protein